MLTVILAWSVLLNHCDLWHRWHQENAGQDLLQLPLRSLSLQDLNTGHKILNSTSPFCPFSQKGNLGACESGFVGAVCVRATDRALVPLRCCCLPRHLGSSGMGLFSARLEWHWQKCQLSLHLPFTLHETTVSCKVNQILLCDDKCYSWKSSWKRLSIRSVQKWTTSRRVLFCWSSAVCGAPGSCAAPRGSSGRMLWVPFETFPVFHNRIRGKGYCHYIEWNRVFDHPWGFDTQNWLKPWAVLCRRQELPEACSIILCVLCSSVDVLGRN